jgi:hypothetical protein
MKKKSPKAAPVAAAKAEIIQTGLDSKVSGRAVKLPAAIFADPHGLHAEIGNSHRNRTGHRCHSLHASLLD